MPSPAASNGAVVIGLDSVTGLQTARLIARRGIAVIGVAANPRHPACRTRACDRIVSAAAGGDALVDALQEIGPGLDQPAVLFPCTDLSVLAISRRRDVLGRWFRMVLPSPGVVETLLDKAAFYRYAEEHGFAVIPSRVLRSIDDVRSAEEALRFPCVVKPSLKTETWQRHTAAKVFRCETPAELRSVYHAHASSAGTLLVQEWIDGPTTAHYTCNAYFDQHADAVATFVSQKLRQWPPEGGVGCLSRACANDAVRDETVRVFGTIGHRGMAYLEMKYDTRTGRHYIIESNVSRPTGRSAAADAAGVELVYSQYCDAVGLPLLRGDQPTTAGKWVYLRQDCQAALHAWRQGTLTPLQWLRSLRGCDSEAMFAWSDPAPFLFDVVKTTAKWRSGKTTPVDTASPLNSRVDDYDLHGLVGVRLVNATRADRDTVERQLGLTRSSFDREPDVVVQFVEGLRSGDLRYVEPGRIAYDDESLVLLREGRRNLRTRVMMDDRGVTEIVCEHGVPAIPLLAHLVNQAALTRGFVAVHASAINYRGLGILMPAWAHGGKTTGLAAFMAHGAQYVGDEWIFIGPGGESMYGAAHPVNLHDWHLAQLPVTGALERARRALVRHAARAVPSQRIEAAVRRRLDREVDPVSVFGADRVRLSSPLDVVMLMVRHDAESIRVEACDPASMINRVEAATASEGLAFRSVALARDFAQGRRSEPPADRFRDRRALLTQALADKPAFVVYHPAECRLEALAEAMVTHCNLFAFGGGAGARAAGRAKPATRASSADGARDGGDRRADEPGPAVPWSVHGVGGDR